jgi:hypothetical protein
MKRYHAGAVLVLLLSVGCGQGTTNATNSKSDVTTATDSHPEEQLPPGCECLQDSMCPDPRSQCLQAVCDDCLCRETPMAFVSCTPESTCALSGTCVAGVCEPKEPVDCNDFNPCTQDSCSPTMGCVHAPWTGPLDQGPCVVDAGCQDGTVVPGKPLDCVDDNPCSLDSCDPTFGCIHAPLSGACDDGNACTTDDTCQDGSCQPGANLCACTTDADCLAYDNGNLCDGILACVDGACAIAQGSTVTCSPPSNPCLAATCEPKTGICLESPLANGSPCFDGDLCTLVDSCLDGVCTGSTTWVCDDANACTQDSCDASSGCLFAAIPNCGKECGDGQCTVGESCVSCPDDCGACDPVCGDGFCQGAEHCSSCPFDCGSCDAVCGDSACTDTESCTTCPTDCGVCPDSCGDGFCQEAESCQNCPEDCGNCAPVCGDGQCHASESCTLCPQDCGACPAQCGDGQCNGTEDCATCQQDCGACNAVCGDGQCNGSETAINCHADCAVGWLDSQAAGFHGTLFHTNAMSCKTCHGPTLDGGVKSCNSCHSGWQKNCTFCHGGKDNQTGAPPFGVGGESASNQKVVGAHTTHVTATSKKVAYTCSTCHKVPADALSAGHVDGDGVAEVLLDECGNGTYSNGSCSAVYCHGNGKSTSSGGSANWTGTSLGCQSCHPNSGLSGAHGLHLGFGFGCQTCHSDTVSNATTIKNTALHVNCTKDVKGAFTYTSSTKTCSNGCHGPKSW